MVVIRKLVFFAFIVATNLAGCSLPPVATDGQPQSSNAVQAEELNQQIVMALQDGRYQDAISAARHSSASASEVDFAIGELILHGWSDPNATQRPAESAREGLALLEQSALAGHQQAISGLAALFYTGLQHGVTGNVLIAPDPPRHTCWKAAKSDGKLASSCVEMR